MQRARCAPIVFAHSVAALRVQEVCEVVATRELENLLKSAMISSASQKLTGVLSDSDIKLLLSIAGLDAKSKTEREQILKNAYRSLRTARQAQQKRLNEISQGLYRETSPAPAGPGED